MNEYETICKRIEKLRKDIVGVCSEIHTEAKKCVTDDADGKLQWAMIGARLQYIQHRLNEAKTCAARARGLRDARKILASKHSTSDLDNKEQTP